MQGVCEHTPGQPLVVQVGMAEEHAPPPALAGQVPPRVQVVVIPGAVVRHRPPQTGSAEQLSPAGQPLFKYWQVMLGVADARARVEEIRKTRSCILVRDKGW